MFQIFVAGKKKLPSSLIVRPMAKIQFATKCINLNVTQFSQVLFFFQAIIGLAYKELGKLFFACDIRRQKFGTCRALNQKEKCYTGRKILFVVF
jgi:hypothetical protein